MTLSNIKEEIPPIARLTYKKGELILKEGDFGVSIYKILKGKVQIFNQSEDKEITLALLGPGEFIGEMALLSKKIEVRSASARAIQNSELEACHPKMLVKEFDKVPPVIRLMTDAAQKRLLRMNKFIVQMAAHEGDKKENIKEKEKSPLRRAYYRKEVDLACTYRPADSPPGIALNGNVKDISLNGINIKVSKKNVSKFSHDPGDEFDIELTLPNGKDIRITARIQAVRKLRVPGTLSLGMFFTDMREGTKKVLGFFLMP